ncbi:PaREP1 family protein [Metallosphaera javensis (ex Sakai et al. 2022)]|uniref:PaREP1 family protein n=1 Tax=Metallosphaera javensis (ex Sakai et al. 2022) TaxID=2775498 RepID=UPI002586A960|nr:MAG: hypothetical protein MjAS7_2774 [Metallosphaera javensis (ex Sakai et al. 2022)]
MEKDLLIVDQNYVIARLIESLDDLLLSAELWNRGFTRNSAGKAFNSVKALLSAIIVKYKDEIEKYVDESEFEWFERKAHIVPTHSMKSLSILLKKIGIDLENLVNLAYDLHEYQYNGFEPGFSPYLKKEDVLEDIRNVITQLPSFIEKYFSKEIKDTEVKDLVERVKKLSL